MNPVVIGIIVAVIVVVVAGSKQIISRIDRLTVPWHVAWLKTLVIVVGISVLVAFLPAWVMTLDAVSEFDRLVQDLIGTGVFVVGFVLSLYLLWWAHGDSRI